MTTTTATIYGQECISKIDREEQLENLKNGKIYAVNADLICRSALNMRKTAIGNDKTDMYLSDMYNSIQSQGLLSVPVARIEKIQHPEAEKAEKGIEKILCAIVAGYGRALSIKTYATKDKYIPVVIDNSYDLEKSIVENLQRKNPSVSEYKVAVERLYNNGDGMSIDKIAKAIGKPASWVLNVLGIQKLLDKDENKELKSLFDSGKISVPLGQKLVKNRAHLDDNLKKIIVKAISEKKPQKEIEDLVEKDIGRRKLANQGKKTSTEIKPKFDKDRLNEKLELALKAKEKAGSFGDISSEHETILYIYRYTDVDISERKKDIEIDAK